MKLLSLEIQDFRQFRGSQRLDFGGDVTKNVTLIHGANGAGKTTLLNAFTWTLYNKLSADFIYPERLINDATWAETPPGSKARCAVVLEFEHKHAYYTLRRIAEAEKHAATSPQRDPKVSVTLSMRTQDQGSEAIVNPNDFVNAVLPGRLHHFFFLNGERFEHLHSNEAFSDIEQAIKTLLGVAVVERALSHLPEAEKRLRKELKDLGEEETAAIAGEQERERDLQEELDRDMKVRRREVDASRDELAAIAARLRDLQSTKDYQRHRDEATASLHRAEASIEDAGVRRGQLLNDRGFLPLINELLDQTLATYEELRVRKEIPTPIKAQFIEDLLEHGTCICGADLKVEGTARDHLLEWKQRAGLPDVEEAWSRLVARAKSYQDDVDRLRDGLDEADTRVGAARAQAERAKTELSEIEHLLKGIAAEDVSRLEDRRRELDVAQETQLKELGRLESKREASEKAYKDAENRLRVATIASQKAQTARSRLIAVEEAHQVLRTLLEIRTEDVRRELDERIKKTFQTISYKNQVPSLTRDFTLRLETVVDGQRMSVAKSTGEGQTLTLAFVGALADLARERYEASDGKPLNPLLSTTGGIFPLVSDAIFGTLDESYRREVAKALPQLAPQVILMVSKAQGAGVVQNELSPYIGAEYVIDFRTGKDDVREETLQLRGKDLPYITRATDGSDEARLTKVEGS